MFLICLAFRVLALSGVQTSWRNKVYGCSTEVRYKLHVAEKVNRKNLACRSESWGQVFAVRQLPLAPPGFGTHQRNSRNTTAFSLRTQGLSRQTSLFNTMSRRRFAVLSRLAASAHENGREAAPRIRAFRSAARVVADRSEKQCRSRRTSAKGAGMLSRSMTLP